MDLPHKRVEMSPDATLRITGREWEVTINDGLKREGGGGVLICSLSRFVKAYFTKCET